MPIEYSFILPTFNRANFLEKVIYSLASQDFNKENYEIIIVDDHSTDDTENTVKSLIEELPNKINYIKNLQNSWQWYSRHIGSINSNGKYLIQTEDDAIYPPNYLLEIDKEIKGRKETWGSIIVLPRRSYNFHEGIVPKITHFRREVVCKLTKEGKRKIIGGWIFPKNVYLQSGWYHSLKIWEDIDLVNKINRLWYSSIWIYSTFWRHCEPATIKKFFLRSYRSWYYYKEQKEILKINNPLWTKVFWSVMSGFIISLIIINTLLLRNPVLFTWEWLIITYLVLFTLTLLPNDVRGIYKQIYRSHHFRIILFIPIYLFAETQGIILGRVKRSFEEKQFFIY